MRGVSRRRIRAQPPHAHAQRALQWNTRNALAAPDFRSPAVPSGQESLVSVLVSDGAFEDLDARPELPRTTRLVTTSSTTQFSDVINPKERAHNDLTTPVLASRNVVLAPERPSLTLKTHKNCTCVTSAASRQYHFISDVTPRVESSSSPGLVSNPMPRAPKNIFITTQTTSAS